MQYRRLGSAGLKVSELSFGGWVTVGGQMDAQASRECILAAYEAGVNFFDNAEGYGAGQSEIAMGQALKELRRESLVISSKVFWGGEGPNDTGLSRKHIAEACRNSLKRMQLDYFDLYFCHLPDPHTPIEETVRAMDDLIHQGLILYWGTSQWSAQQIMEAYGLARQYGLVPPQMEQPIYNLLARERVERELARLYTQIGLGATTFSPLASGVLTGKYNDGIPDGSRAALEGFDWLRRNIAERENIERVRRLAPIAADLGCTLAQLALAWCLKNPHVSTVITGASRVQQLRENLPALKVVEQLTPDVMERIDQVLANKPATD
ncbi:MAG TPA: aldo/keto reductase [Anaerolineae bacterium]|nr:aldo/keto reductase [Anaerolineae bacterium]